MTKPKTAKSQSTEEGEAGIAIRLSHGKIQVWNSDTGELLLTRNVTEGFWERLWKTLSES